MAKIEKLGSLPISGNLVEDPNVEESLELHHDKINELIDAVNIYHLLTLPPNNLTNGSPVQEALLTLHQDLSEILANNWADIPSDEIKARINAAIAKSLRTGI